MSFIHGYLRKEKPNTADLQSRKGRATVAPQEDHQQNHQYFGLASCLPTQPHFTNLYAASYQGCVALHHQGEPIQVAAHVPDMAHLKFFTARESSFQISIPLIEPTLRHLTQGRRVLMPPQPELSGIRYTSLCYANVLNLHSGLLPLELASSVS